MADVSTLAGATLLILVVLAWYAGWGQSTGPRQRETLRLQIRDDGNVTQEPERSPLPLYLPLLAAGLIALVLMVL